MKPSTPKGTRDFGPEEVARRNFIFSIIKEVFSLYGFQPIETPSFENSETLLGKYGEEGDRLIYRILNSGDYLSKVDAQTYEEKNSLKMSSIISDRALRYDLTVPFARFVVQHQNDLVFPFKRYQIQPVWRADRPQKGRFREFYQCDADVIGSDSLWQEVEFIRLYDTVFDRLGLKGVSIKINNRKILSGIAEIIGAEERLIDFTVALDKLDKIGVEGVEAEMKEKGISEEAVEKLSPLLNLSGGPSEKLVEMKAFLKDSEIGKEGVEELEFVVDTIGELGLKSSSLVVDITLARGLNYYTGIIIEIGAPEGVKMGSIGGGGRYDDLTGIFGLKNMSGVGISFGLDRIYLVMEELDLFPEAITGGSDVLFINFGDKEALYALKAVMSLRENGVKAELYPDQDRMGKQMGYADRRKIPFTVLAGEKEMEKNVFTLKNMNSGDQQTLGLEELIAEVKKGKL